MPLGTRTFRIFVSSTFIDLKEERNDLRGGCRGDPIGVVGRRAFPRDACPVSSVVVRPSCSHGLWG